MPKPVKVLMIVTALSALAVVWWLSVGYGMTNGSVMVSGVEWRLAANHAVEHADAERQCPEGFRTPTVPELEALASSSEARGHFPQLFQSGEAVWSNQKVTLRQAWFVVSLADGTTATHVFDFPAWALVRRASGREDDAKATAFGEAHP